MALKSTLKGTEFAVGDKVRVHQKVKDGDKNREAIFEGMVIAIKGRGIGKTFTARRIGEAGIGIEKIFPLELPTIEKIVIVKKGVEGVRRAKLYYIRTKSPTEVEMIYKRSLARSESGKRSLAKSSKIKKRVSKKKK